MAETTGSGRGTRLKRVPKEMPDFIQSIGCRYFSRYQSGMISDDEFLERIVAGIHAVTTEGADVKWNEKINGRQFDVVVRFRLGSLNYFVVVEVKNKTRRLPVQDMESFVTKCRDHNVNKAVFVTVSGYQKGALDVAKKHGVELFTITFLDDLHVPRNASFIVMQKRPLTSPPSVTIGEPTLVANLTDFRLVYDDGQVFMMPDERSQLGYYMEKTTFPNGQNLREMMDERPEEKIEVGRTLAYRLPVMPPQRITPPDDYVYPSGTLVEIRYNASGVMGRGLSGNARIDPNLLVGSVLYINVLTDEVLKLGIDELPLGSKKIDSGKFYFIANPLMYYYCENIKGDIVTWILVESFQNGTLIRCKLKQNIEFAYHYIPVSDKLILSRLRRRLDDYLRLEGVHLASENVTQRPSIGSGTAAP